ncbi:MAG: hypothetical protein ABI480_17015, partial [Chitinophagaceae bacterium]
CPDSYREGNWEIFWSSINILIMKQLTFIALLLSVLLLSGCDEKLRPFQVYFWTSAKSSTTYYLYLNDTIKGELPYLPEQPECGDGDAKKKTLHLTMESGTYKIQIKNEEGVVKYTQQLKIKLSNHSKEISTSTDDRKGGARNVNEGDCLIEEIYY